MAVRKDKIIKLGSGKEMDARAEFYTCAEEVVTDCRNRNLRIPGYDVDKSMSTSWEGVSSYDEALQLMRDGYSPVVDDFRNELKVTPKEGPRYSFKNAIQGFAPIVPLALKCVPNSMVDMHIKPIKAKVLDVYYDMTALAGTEANEFIKAGKSVLGTIIELEKQGYKFNLFAIQTYVSGGEGTVDTLCVKVKSSNKPLDLKRMSFPLTHPAFFRVIGFDWQGKSPITRDLGYGRGRDLGHEYDRKDLVTFATQMFGDNACYISCSNIIGSDYDRDMLKESFINGANKRKSKD